MMTKSSSATISFDADCIVAFDLDDTLCQEVDFLRSGFKAVSDHFSPRLNCEIFSELLELYEQGHKDAFGEVLNRRGLTAAADKTEMLDIYRGHIPQLKLTPEAESVLRTLKARTAALALITDGRSVTQRNKLRALDIEHLFDPIVISEEVGSEKPAEANYRLVMERHPGRRYFYIGDNTAKDFVTPNRLGWRTVCLLSRGRNIHEQTFVRPAEYLPQFTISSLDELIRFA